MDINVYDKVTISYFHLFSVAVCNELEMIVNGEITYNSDMVAPYAIGTKATYSCGIPYALVINPGHPVKTCEDAGDDSGGRFSGQAPSCAQFSSGNVDLLL